MPRYKAFCTASDIGSLTRMEHEINEWMEREHPRILHMTQSASDNTRNTGMNLMNVVVSFVYDLEAAESLGAAMAATAVPDVFERTLDGADLDPEIETENDTVLLPEAELPY
ncbi:MAG: hypothetical protein ACRDHP_02500 [Ktedonobacterales bacterium]